jgi:hypothetical protein
MLQCFSNQRSVGVAALLPSDLLLYALLAPDSAMAVAAANWLESAVSAVLHRTSAACNTGKRARYAGVGRPVTRHCEDLFVFQDHYRSSETGGVSY